jgi:hypothetical protein
MPDPANRRGVAMMRISKPAFIFIGRDKLAQFDWVNCAVLLGQIASLVMTPNLIVG